MGSSRPFSRRHCHRVACATTTPADEHPRRLASRATMQATAPACPRRATSDRPTSTLHSITTLTPHPAQQLHASRDDPAVESKSFGLGLVRLRNPRPATRRRRLPAGAAAAPAPGRSRRRPSTRRASPKGTAGDSRSYGSARQSTAMPTGQGRRHNGGTVRAC